MIGTRIVKEIRERLTFLDDVGVGYLNLDRASATLSGGEAQRLRLATQIGSQLVGVLYILDEPSIGLHQRDNGKLIGTLERLRDLGNTVVVVEHDEQMMRSRRLARRHGAGRGRARRPRRRRGDGRQGREATARRSPGSSSRARARSPCRERRDRGPRLVHRARRVAAQPEGDRRRVPGRQVRLRHRRVRLGQVDARQRDRLQGAAPTGCTRCGRSRASTTSVEGIDVLRQGDRHRPVADRPDAALEPGHLHRPVHADPRALLADARGEGARLQAGAVLVQRPRRPLRDVQGRRADQDRDALPARRLRPVRDVQGRALQPRDARGALQGQEHLRGARHVGRGGAAVLRQDPEDPAEAADAPRRRARLHQARPAGDDALGRRGAAREARRRSSRRSRPARRSTSSTSRRPASTSPTSRSCSRCCSGSSTRATPCS